MTLHIQPIADYSNVDHYKGSTTNFVHPRTGNIYSAAIEGGDLVIRRMPPTIPAHWEEIRRYVKGVHAVGVFDMGGAVINRHGVLVTTFICQPKDHPLYKPDGFPKFQSCWDWEAGVDDPYLVDPTVEELKAEVAALKAQVAMMAQQIDAIGTGGSLSAEDRASLDWTAKVRALE
jgi:hypothetical protein